VLLDPEFALIAARHGHRDVLELLIIAHHDRHRFLRKPPLPIAVALDDAATWLAANRERLRFDSVSGRYRVAAGDATG